MKNVLKAFGLIALVAVIGFSIAACKEDDGGGNDGKFNGHTLSKGSPPAATLSKYGITTSVMDNVFAKARAVVDPDYLGYYEDTINQGVKVSILCYVWLKKTKAKYDSVCATLGNDLEWTFTGLDLGAISGSNIPKDTVTTTGGAYGSESSLLSSKSCSVQYYLKDFKDENGNTVPKDTLVVSFMIMSLF